MEDQPRRAIRDKLLAGRISVQGDVLANADKAGTQAAYDSLHRRRCPAQEADRLTTVEALEQTKLAVATERFAAGRDGSEGGPWLGIGHNHSSGKRGWSF